MLEYIVFGALIVIFILVLLMYQKINSKEKPDESNQLSLASIQERLGIIEKAQTNFKVFTFSEFLSFRIFGKI